MRPALRWAKWNDFADMVSNAVIFEDKLHSFYIVLLQFIVVDAVYLESGVAGRVVYDGESSEGACKSDEQAKNWGRGSIFKIRYAARRRVLLCE
jgi:hypothetical protein